MHVRWTTGRVEAPRGCPPAREPPRAPQARPGSPSGERLSLLMACVAVAAASGCGADRSSATAVDGMVQPALPVPSASGANTIDETAARAVAHQRGSLLARPRRQGPTALAPGKTPLGLGGPRDGFLYLPAAPPAGPLPLLVFLHGAGGDAGQVEPLMPFAEQHGVLVLSIDSRASTWDIIGAGLGPDVAFLDRALEVAFERHPVDASRVALSGFSDGASYALTLGLANGELFSHVLAFSPGFSAPPMAQGSPRVYVSHGTRDMVLPIDACSRRIVPRLRGRGYAVRYEEFEGGHTMPGGILAGALAWMLSEAD